MVPGMYSRIATDAEEVVYTSDVEVSGAIGLAFETEGPLHVVTAAGVERTIPAGILAAKVIHPIAVQKVFDDSSVGGLWIFRG